MKAYQEDLEARLSGKSENELHGRIVFKGKGNAYYSVSIEDDQLKVYKSGFADDRLQITISMANVILIK